MRRVARKRASEDVDADCRGGRRRSEDREGETSVEGQGEWIVREMKRKAGLG